MHPDTYKSCSISFNVERTERPQEPYRAARHTVGGETSSPRGLRGAANFVCEEASWGEVAEDDIDDEYVQESEED